MLHLRFLGRLVLALVGIVAIFLIVGSLLPRAYQFETRIEIGAPPHQVFPYFNNLTNWQKWSSYSPLVNQDLNIEYSAVTEGVDAAQTWSDRRGRGKLWITQSTPDREVQYSVDFEGFPRMTSLVQFNSMGDKTEVLWKSEGSLPSGPFYGWFGMYFSGALKNDYQSSLNRLKQVVENEQAAENSIAK